MGGCAILPTRIDLDGDLQTLISLKAGNAIVISPHPPPKPAPANRAVMQQASRQAPDGLIQCINKLDPQPRMR